MGVKSFSCTAFGVGGGPASGALCSVYTRNTTTRKTTYADSGLTVPRTNPVVGDSDGRIGPAYFDDSLDLTFRVTTSDGATRLLDVDYRGGTFAVTFIQSDQLQLFERTASGDGSQTVFLLSGVVAATPYHIDITYNIGGVRSFLPKSTYDVSSDGTDTTVTFGSAPPLGTDNITFTSAIMQGLPGPQGPPGDGVAIYSTLAAIMALTGTDFDAGDILYTAGHQSAMDGCGAEYVVYATLPLLSDGVTSHPVDNLGLVNALSGSKWAINREYIRTRRISCPMFGADGRSANQKTYLDNWFNTYKSVQTTATGGSFFGDDLQVCLYAPAGRWASSTEVMYAPTDDQFRLRGEGESSVFENIGFQLDGLLDPLIEDIAIDGLAQLDRGLYLGATAANNKGTFNNIIINNCTVACLEIRRDTQSVINNPEFYNGGTASTSGTGNLVVSGTTGTQINGGVISSAKYDNVVINPATPDSGTIGVGELKMNGVGVYSASRRNLYVTGTDAAQAWECYFTGCTFTGARSASRTPRTFTVTSITNNGGFVQLNFSGAHTLSRNLTDSTMTFVGASITLTSIRITDIISSTAVLTNKVYTANDTGTLSLQDFDIYIDGAGSTAEGVFQMHFNGGNANYVHIGKSNEVRFSKTFRAKVQRYQTSNARNVDWPSNAGGFYNDFTDTVIDVSGPGSYQANARSEFVPGSNASPSAAYWRTIAPNYAAGLAADQMPVSYYEIDTKQTGLNIGLRTRSSGAWTGMQFDGTAFNAVTAGAEGFPLRSFQTKATGGIGDRTFEARNAEAINVRDFYPNGYTTPADGTSHTLGGFYANLAAAQVDYPFAVSTSQQIDACALHKAYLAQIGNTFGSQYAATGERALYAPAGTYYVPSSTISSIADNGGGTILVTTSAAHNLFAGGWVFLSENTYAGGYQVLTAPSSTTFTVTAAFTATATGRASFGIGQSGTGQHLFGDGLNVTRFDGPNLIVYHRAFTFDSFSLTGADGAGIAYVNSSRRFSHGHHVHVRDRRYAVWGGAGTTDVLSACLFEKTIRGVHFPLAASSSVLYLDSCIIQNSTTFGMFAPTGEVKMVGGQISSSGCANLLLRERLSGTSSVECYFDTSITVAAAPTFYSITGVTDNGDGTVTVTTSASHNLEPDDEVEHFNTTDYNGLKSVVKVPSRTTYTITATYTSSRTGSMRYKHDRIWRITGITNAGGGNIEVTTDGTHDLRGGMTSITIAGTTDYNGTYTIVARTGTTTFTVAATWTSSQTGTVSLRNWDVVTDADGALTDVNDMWFGALCNINYMKIHGANKITCYGRLKQQIHMSAAFDRFVMYGDMRGRNSDTFSDIIPDGPYSNTNWVAFAARDDSTTSDNDSYASIMRPHAATSVGTDGFPLLNEKRISATGEETYVAGVLVNQTTSALNSTTLPFTAMSGTAVPAGGTAGAGLKLSSTANLGVFFGSGAPSLSAAQGSLYLRTDGSSTSTRAYINTNGSTTWTAITTAA